MSGKSRGYLGYQTYLGGLGLGHGWEGTCTHTLIQGTGAWGSLHHMTTHKQNGSVQRTACVGWRFWISGSFPPRPGLRHDDAGCLSCLPSRGHLRTVFPCLRRGLAKL